MMPTATVTCCHIDVTGMLHRCYTIIYIYILYIIYIYNTNKRVNKIVCKSIDFIRGVTISLKYKESLNILLVCLCSNAQKCDNGLLYPKRGVTPP
jgi:hypothetical protein